MEKRLLKDIIIPAGTIFSTAPPKTSNMWGGIYECVFGLTKDSFGTVRYAVEDITEKELKEYFETVK